MKRIAGVAACLLVLAGIYWVAQAGSLEPPGPPAPTMVTLQEIYDKIDGLVPGAVGVAKTGQTNCWNEIGTPIACAGTGQDGEYQYGLSVDPRFNATGDGTVRDNLTGLIWLQDANCFGSPGWTPALSAANTLADGSCGLTDGSEAGDWRLPNVRELHSLIDYGQFNPVLPPGHPFSGVQSAWYWSSTATLNFPDHAWGVHLEIGHVASLDGTGVYYVWPVRDGQ